MGALKIFAKLSRKSLRQSDLNVYKLIEWDPATFSLSMSATETVEKCVKYVTVETIEKGVKYFQSFGSFIINFEHISDLLIVFTMNR